MAQSASAPGMPRRSGTGSARAAGGAMFADRLPCQPARAVVSIAIDVLVIRALCSDRSKAAV
jgi:hypothetical protein